MLNVHRWYPIHSEQSLGGIVSHWTESVVAGDPSEPVGWLEAGIEKNLYRARQNELKRPERQLQ